MLRSPLNAIPVNPVRIPMNIAIDLIGLTLPPTKSENFAISEVEDFILKERMAFKVKRSPITLGC